MALPVVIKTWEYNVNQSITGTSTDTKLDNLLIAIKDTLKAFVGAGWTVWGSCDGAGGAGSFGNNDGVDRWVNDTDVVHAAAGSNHSWFVLTNPTTSLQLCIDCVPATTTQASFIVSFAGFNSDGTATARPTAADAATLDTGEVAINNPSRFILHGMQSSDGSETRIFAITETGVVCTFLMFGVSASLPSGLVWDGRYACAVNSNSASTPTYASLWSAASVKMVIGGAACTAYMTGESCNGSLAAAQMYDADDDTDYWALSPMGLYCPTVGHRGLKGLITDMWWGYSGASTGNTYPANAPGQFAQFADVVVPWNGTVMRIG